MKPQLVMAENVAQAAQFAESGNADLGLISLTLAKSEHLKEVGTYVRVPTVYPTISQCAVVMKKCATGGRGCVSGVAAVVGGAAGAGEDGAGGGAVGVGGRLVSGLKPEPIARQRQVQKQCGGRE